MQWREGTVEQVRGRWPGAVEYAVRLAGDGPDVDLGPDGDGRVRALAYTALVGEPQVGDRVLLNASRCINSTAACRSVCSRYASASFRSRHSLPTRSTFLKKTTVRFLESA